MDFITDEEEIIFEFVDRDMIDIKQATVKKKSMFPFDPNSVFDFSFFFT